LFCASRRIVHEKVDTSKFLAKILFGGLNVKKNSTIFQLQFEFSLLGLVVGYITGNSLTSVSVIVVSSLLGLMGSVVSVIIEGKGDNERISKNLDTVGRIFFWFLLAMVFGIVLGSLFKALWLKNATNKDSIFYYLPPISHDITN
jgi:hypothetical protein